MPNDNNQNQLLQLRKNLDEIDEKIINLLGERMKIIAEVGEYKKSIHEKFFIKSAREADMIKALVAKAGKSIPASAIISIWRKIITSANCLEQNLKIAIHNPQKIPDYEYLVKEYYSDFIPLLHHDNATDVILDLEKQTAQIGIFALDKSLTEHWWISLANNRSNIKIFAKIPFLQNQNSQTPELFAVAIKPAEKSQDDKTLLMVELDKHISKAQIQNTLKEAGLNGEIIKSTNLEQVSDITFYLLELDGFFEENDEKIKKLCASKIKPFVRILGHFATPIAQ